jgi:hypothetical protein
MARAPAVAGQLDAACPVRGEDRSDVVPADPAVVEPFREDHEVAGEAVAADVRRLPDPVRVRLAQELP